VTHEIEHVSDDRISQIRRLWTQTATNASTEQFSSLEQELQGYYSATICSILEVLYELESASKDSTRQKGFANIFQEVRPQLVRRLRLLSEIGRVMLPDDFDSTNDDLTRQVQ
jgi:hypothetical protein